MAQFNTIAIIGLGLIGGSFAKLIKNQQPHTTVWAWDNHAPSLQLALEQGVIDAPLSGMEDVRLKQADLIVLGTHLSTSYGLLTQLAQAIPNAAMMDLGSTKVPICKLADELPQLFCFVGGHPLAGREVSGFQNSVATLFSGKRFLLSPCQKTPTPWLDALCEWLSDLSVEPIIIDAQQHDKLMSLVSHFPQFYALALANLLHMNEPEIAMDFLGGGIDDQMRLMASSQEMWRDVYQDNQHNMDALLTQFINVLQAMQQDLRHGNLERWFNTSHQISQVYRERQARQNNPLVSN